MPEPQQVRAMFSSIAPRYDLLNRVLSMGIDVRWRKRVLARAGETKELTQPQVAAVSKGVAASNALTVLKNLTVLDVCCGTGDLALEFERHGSRVVGVDFTRPMLEFARDKETKVPFIEGDALALPAPDSSFDVATVAFGLRNVADRHRGLAEMARVVRPGGQVMVLEFSTPRSRVFAAGYRFYFHRVLPRIGGWVSKNPSAYRYLPDSVDSWPDADELQRDFESSGLIECGYERLTGGIACLHYGRVKLDA